MSDSTEGGNDRPIADIDFLSSSSHRMEILDVLRRDGPLFQRDIRDSVAASRSTVRRTLEGFLERGWIESVEDGYRTTLAGEFVADAFNGLSETIDVTRELAPLLRWLPNSEFDADPEWLADGSLTISTATDPYAPAREQTETVATASRFRGWLPGIELEGAELVTDRIVGGELTAEVVLGPDGSETVRSDPFADLFREKLATGRLRAFAREEPLPYYLGLADDRAVEIGVADDEGIPRALFRSTRTELREWGETKFERSLKRATELTVADF